MGIGQIICGIISIVLAIGAFVISYFQFREKGYLFNNAYFWASQEERRRMDENKESKSHIIGNPVLHLCLLGSSF